MKKISFSLSASDVSKAIKQLRRYQAWVEKKSDELTARLAQIGAVIASIVFTGVMYEDQDPVQISVDPIENGYEIKAEGKSVCFLEFGAGVYAGAGYSGKHGDISIQPGSFSSSVNGKGEFSKHNSWHYNGKKFVGIVPAKGMYEAQKEIELKARDIIKEVFSE